MERIILFDGECHFCNKSVQFIIKRDPNRLFKFASLQSDVAKARLEKFDVPNNTDSFVLIENDNIYMESSAALRICKSLKGFWPVLYFLIIVPKQIRNFFYKIIAKNRYRLSVKSKVCILPSTEDRHHFL